MQRTSRMESSLFIGLGLGIVLGFSMGFYFGLTFFKRKPNEREAKHEEPVKKREREKSPKKVKKNTPKHKDSPEEIARQQALLQEQIEHVKKSADSAATESNDLNRRTAEKFNNECSNCGHKVVVDEIKYDPNAKAHKVRKCTGCGNEWEPKSYSYEHESAVLEKWLMYIRRFLEAVHEKKEDAYTGTWAGAIKRTWGTNIAIETIWELSKLQPSHRSEHHKISKVWNSDALKALDLKDLRYKEQDKRDITGILDDGH